MHLQKATRSAGCFIESSDEKRGRRDADDEAVSFSALTRGCRPPQGSQQGETWR